MATYSTMQQNTMKWKAIKLIQRAFLPSCLGTTVAPTTTTSGPTANSKDFSNNGLVTENGQEISAEDMVEAKMRQIKVLNDKFFLFYC